MVAEILLWQGSNNKNTHISHTLKSQAQIVQTAREMLKETAAKIYVLLSVLFQFVHWWLLQWE